MDCCYLLLVLVLLSHFLLIVSGIIGDRAHGPKYLIFLTFWGFILLNTYLLFAAISVTYKYVSEKFLKKTIVAQLEITDLRDPNILGCRSSCISPETDENIIPWYLQLMWVLYILSSQLAIPISIFYWFTFDGTVNSWPLNLHEHVLNLFPGFIDLFVSGIPVRLFHSIYLIGFGVVYASFTGIYYGAGGTNSKGDNYIYSVLDYEESPGVAIAMILFMTFLVPIIISLIFWGLYLLRTLGLRYRLMRRDPVHVVSYNRGGSIDSRLPLSHEKNDTNTVTIKILS